jgi:hypothetical protein
LTDIKTDRIVPIEVSNHTTDTLTDAVQEALNTVFGTGVFSVSYDESKLKLSITAELCNYTAQSQTARTFKSGIVDLRRFHDVYISSANLSSFQTLGSRGESNIIKKVPVTTEYGFTILDNIAVSHYWIDVSKLLLKTLEFRLSDAYGKTIDLRGAPISFSLVFMDQSD